MIRRAEYLLLFFGVVGAYLVFHPPGGPIPPLLLAAAAVVVHLRRNAVDLLRPEALRPVLRGMLLRWALISLLTLAGVAVFLPGHLFDLPRRDPAMWAAIMVFYPLASVYPQELLYRGFLLHRYAPAFGAGRAVAVAGAAAFGFAHLLFGNLLAVLATLVGGWMFMRRYQRTGSLLAVSVEHALYGLTIFTVGLGDFFYHGVQR